MKERLSTLSEQWNTPVVHICLRRGSHAIVRNRTPGLRDVQKCTQVVCIEDVQKRSSWPRGLYLFTGLDGMNPAQIRAARWLYAKLKQSPEFFRPLNDPDRLLHRYDLLKKLHEQGINDFNVHHVTGMPPDVRFPAFVRYERLHRANLTPLLNSRDELDDAICKLLLSGERQEELMVTEFVDYRDDDGAYRKYGALQIGSDLFARHLQAGHNWAMKRKHTVRSVVGNDELEYVRNFPYREQIEEVLCTSGHEWARIDYSLFKGRIQVWEINDNPEQAAKFKRGFWRGPVHEVAVPKMLSALDRVLSGVEPGPSLLFSVPTEAIVGSCLNTGRM